eukprot:TRINITY_DN24005_c0_g1_i2.p2 TRINITY_DN24005_c0_g1~~TRINITY_DN24005_c0_g1_i2.p2  ORF type:complete len:151 (-),score=44.50 TRINITY_DN24005_c0_g1_i2:706-1158(-)
MPRRRLFLFAAESFWLVSSLSHLFIIALFASNVHANSYGFVPLLYQKMLELYNERVSKEDLFMQETKDEATDGGENGRSDAEIRHRQSLHSHAELVPRDRNIQSDFLQKMRDVPPGFTLGTPTVVVTRKMVLSLASILFSCFFLFQQWRS